jgi:hypothetical protein
MTQGASNINAIKGELQNVGFEVLKKKEAIYSSETSVVFQRPTLRYPL